MEEDEVARVSPMDQPSEEERGFKKGYKRGVLDSLEAAVEAGVAKNTIIALANLLAKFR